MVQSFQDNFSDVARRYADFRPHYPPALFDYLATLVPSNSVVWDCAAGNGQATVDLADRFDKVIGTDGSREQLKAAAKHNKVQYRVALAESCGLSDHSVSLVTVGQALHWFELERFYAEVKRVLRNDGVLAVWSYGIIEVEGEEVNKIVLDFYSKTIGSYWTSERKLVEEGYNSLPFPFSEIKDAPSFVMEANWTLDQLLGYVSTWSATSRYVKAEGKDPTVPLKESLKSLWGDSTRRVSWPLALRLGRKTT